ncbi:hypothetical protein M569_04578, partial [Genlisea aurea]
CSLTCFKKHKEIPCLKPEPVDESEVLKQNQLLSIGKYVSKNVYPVLFFVVKRICLIDSVAASSEEIRDAVKNEKLQTLICSIDSSADPETELERAMEGDESFRLFTQKVICL